jgi:hypothetical protein
VKRRGFFKLLGVGATAVAVAPVALIPERAQSLGKEVGDKWLDIPIQDSMEAWEVLELYNKTGLLVWRSKPKII